MNKKTLKALLGSIKKWHKIVIGKGTDKGEDNCPLCELFDDECEDCPVSKKVNDTCCYSTPYRDWSKHRRGEHYGKMIDKVYCTVCKKLALAELRFLINLLPVKYRKPVRAILKNNLTIINKEFKKLI